jgi:hypothetical protein
MPSGMPVPGYPGAPISIGKVRVRRCPKRRPIVGSAVPRFKLWILCSEPVLLNLASTFISRTISLATVVSELRLRPLIHFARVSEREKGKVRRCTVDYCFQGAFGLVIAIC